MKHRLNDLTNLLHRRVESAAQSRNYGPKDTIRNAIIRTRWGRLAQDNLFLRDEPNSAHPGYLATVT